jgi:hypothetical protein
MVLTNVWLHTLGDGLIRADQIVGALARRTPAVAGKPAHWLLTVVLPMTTGSGQPDIWVTSPLHRTLIQTSDEPADAPEDLTRLLSQLDATDAAGVITAALDEPAPASTNSTPQSHRSSAISARSASSPPSPPPPPSALSLARSSARATVRFRFTPFRGTDPGYHYDPEYL